MSELHDLSATEQVRALRDRTLSSRELTKHYLDRIDKHDQQLGAFVTVDHDMALDAADRADSLLARGEAAPLTGLPMGIKDLHAAKGMQTTAGSAVLLGHMSTADEWTVALLRDAGAVIVGKTNASELGATCYTDGDAIGRPAVTPYDPLRYSSGSSGGAATAVAAGLLPVAHGSDGAGSIRTPAATTNLVGVKPSRGLVNAAPVSFMAPASGGPLARTVADAALMLDVMGRSLPGDLHAWRPTIRFSEGIRSEHARKLRIATWSESGLDRVDTHPELVDAMDQTTLRLQSLGHGVHVVANPARIDADVIQALRVWMVSSVALSATEIFSPEQQTLLTPLTRSLIEESRSITGAEVVRSQARLARYASEFLTMFEDFDAALTPTTTTGPVPLGHFFKDGVDGVLDRMLDWTCFTPWVNLTGQPAVSLPAGFDQEGLPLGVQLVGRPRSDVDLLNVAQQLESMTLWHTSHPMCWSD